MMKKIGLIAALLASAQPALAVTGSAPMHHSGSWAAPAAAQPELPGVADRVADAVRKGLISLATVFTNAGAAIVTNRMIQAGTAPVNIGWGTGSTDDALTRTALVTEAAPTTGGGRTVGTQSRTTITVANDNYQVTGTVTAAGALAITEAGLFDAVTAGNMLIRSTFAAINVALNDSIAFTFGLKFVPG